MSESLPNVKFDSVTKQWFKEHPGEETTVMQCIHCRKFYKPDLGHRCGVLKR